MRTFVYPNLSISQSKVAKNLTLCVYKAVKYIAYSKNIY